MAVRTLTESLDNLYTTTWRHQKDTVIDQIFDATPFWFWMKDKGRLKTERGGRNIAPALQYAKNESVGWIGKGGVVSMNDFEFLTNAKYDWKYLYGNIVRFGVDDQQNSGKAKIIDLMNAKLENTKNALVDELEGKLFADTAAGMEIDGLQHLVADDAAGTVGGINSATYTWWANKQATMTGLSMATFLVPKMRTMMNDTGNNLRMDQCDIIVCGQTPYEAYEDVAFDKYMVQNTKLAEMGFDTQTFKGKPMIWSPSCANTRMYFLNTNFLSFTYDPMMNFEMTEWKAIPDQVNDRAAQIITAGTFLTTRRRCQGVLHTMDTA